MNSFNPIPIGKIWLLVTFLMMALTTSATASDSSSDSLTIDFEYEILLDCGFIGQTLTATAMPNGGVPPYRYLWWDGSTDSLTHSGAVPFFIPPFTVVTVTDATGCEVEGTIYVITTPIELYITVSVTDATCLGDSTGSIDVRANGGEPPYQIEWSDPNLPSEFIQTSLPSGAYELTIVDGLNCSVTSSVTIYEPQEISIVSAVNPESNGNSDGAINLTVTGGTPNANGEYSYQWYRDSLLIPDTIQDLFNIPAGEYQVIITDDNGCMQSSELIIVENLVAAFDLNPSFFIQLYPQPAQDYLLLEWKNPQQSEQL